MFGRTLPAVYVVNCRHNIFAPGPNYQTRSYAALWADMIPEYEVHTFERGGYYAVEEVPNKLAVISLNTLYWYCPSEPWD
jgi:endopolyphosphatase